MASMTQQTCQNCRTKFMARTADVNRGWGKFCSKRCKATSQERRTEQFGRLENKDLLDIDYMHPQEEDNFSGSW